jgi:hypothetical protein
MPRSRHALAVSSLLVASLLFLTDAHAVVVQVDGTIVPTIDGGTDCEGNLQVCLDQAEGVTSGPSRLDAILDAAQVPEVFVPNTTRRVVFRNIAEGAGFENSFGYYNVGDDITNTANLRPILGCGVPATTHANEANGYLQNSEPGSSTEVDFAIERSSGRYRGGQIGFYLIAPEGRPDTVANCGDFAGSSFFGRIYFTQRELNNDGDFVHHLVYQSRLPGVSDRFYFGFEDLFRGGDNDFEDMLIQVTGLTPPCVPGVEVCNGRDDDCDGLVDAADPSLSGAGTPCTCNGSGGLTCEGGNRQGVCLQGATACVAGALLCRSTTSPSAELCNGLDDNCNGIADESASGTGVACDGPDADLCPEGTTVCTAGALACTDTTGANVELCNGSDDDCDGRIDEAVAGLGVACDGPDGDLCPEGVTVCTGGVLGCTDTTPTNPELCNGVDDDCNGVIDNSPTGVGVACSVGVGLCRRNGATVCTGGAVACNVAPGSPSSEACNTLDDDCDGAVDEDYMLGAGCVAPGACGAGVLECAGPTATRCSSGPGGSMSRATPELCNGLDDDCDSIVDEGLTDLGSCGSDVGECAPGRLRCLAAAPTCVGGVGPLPELCNAADDDCDGRTDESPTDAGDACGSDVGECTAGIEQCIAGALTCRGAVGPRAELCNALDDDCNGISDDSPTDVGTSCGTTDLGVCELGRTICVAGSPRCAGATEPNVETCNGLDDDCDGTVDDDPIDVGRTCGSALGTCLPGITVCRGGAVACEGGTVGIPEICNGIDDDCDSVIDDMPTDEGGACGESEGVCEEGALRCIAGTLQCVGGVLPGTEVCNGLDDDCDGTIDDGDLCEGGVCAAARCSVPCIMTEFGARCPPGETCVEGFCVEDACFGVTCERGADGSRNVCQDGACVPVCDTVSCPDPNVCRRTDGACVGNNCNFLPYLCEAGEICVRGECVGDPCAGVTCGAREFCRAGDCVGSCAGVSCGPTERCRGGRCEATGCAQPCGERLVCDAESGNCVPDPCLGASCTSGQVCDPSRGGCIEDPCRNVRCPTGEVCRLGECYAPPTMQDGGVGFDASADRVLAAGGIGCAVSARGGSGSAWLALFGLLAVAVVVRRRRSGLGAIGLGLVALALTLGGCEVQPYCLEGCRDGSLDGGTPDDADPRRDVVISRPDGCVPGALDECNEADDDCDGFVDEDIDVTRDGRNCGACGVSCVRAGAQTECEDSACVFRRCFDGFVDLNGDTAGDFGSTDGCEYRCFQSNGGVEACDTLDNDCDGTVDEDFDLAGDEANCGRCGQVCSFFRVTTSTCEAGTCRFDPATDCSPGYLDANGAQADGCEYQCTPAPGATETCNGLDDDCDGRTDEDFALDTDVSNCGRCGRVCSFPNATPHCVTGTCGFEPATDCTPGFSDNDGVQLNGCEYPCTPTADPTEICDGRDNDCDGRVDGATTDAGGSCNRAPGGVARGVCTSTGTVTCVAGSLVCVGAPEPTVERCNGRDDDCDGRTDESPVDVGRVCQPAVGTCTAGFSVCRAGALDCERAVGPVPERCNGLDDDCDGTIDDSPTDPGLGGTCGTDTGACTSGTLTCMDGALRCAGSVGPTPERCNGTDDDCDGLTDDDPIDQGGSCGSSIGACVPGTEVCTAGSLVCIGGVSASMELCNGVDDNCNGSTDEGLTRGCYTGASATRGVGVCRDGTQLCVGGTFGTCAGQVLPSTETCNGLDDDCDTRIDEGVTSVCYTGPSGTEGVGLCRAGVRTCSMGTFGACTGQVLPTGEFCDGQDQDCDGRIDEGTGGGPMTRSCYTGPTGTSGVGTCGAGTQTCRFGAFGLCAGEVTPTIDRCGDGLDTDCDGLGDVAEGCLSPSTELRIDTGTDLGSSHSYDVRLAAGGSPTGRNVYAVWVDKRNGADTADVWFSRSTDGGATWSAPVDLTTGTGDRAVRPELAVGRTTGGQDVIHVAYQVVPVSGTASTRVRQMWVRSSTNSGTSFGTPLRLDTTAGTDNFKHAIATNATGDRVVVAWEQLNTTTLARRVLSRASTDSGGTWAAERLVSVNVGTSPTAGEPVVAVTSAGRFVFAWREARPPTRSTFDVYATFSDDATTAIPTARERRLDGDTGQTRASDELRIAVAASRVYVAWLDVSTSAGGGGDIVFSQSGDGGATWSAERIVDDPTMSVSDSSEPTLAVDPRTTSADDDVVMLAWRDTRDGTQIFFASSANSGSTWGTPVRASQQAGAPVPGVCDSPRIAHAGPSTVVVAYVNTVSGARPRVRAATSIDAGANWLITDPTLDGGGGRAVDPAIVRVDGTGLTVAAAVAWIDYRSGARTNGDVYRVRVGR